MELTKKAVMLGGAALVLGAFVAGQNYKKISTYSSSLSRVIYQAGSQEPLPPMSEAFRQYMQADRDIYNEFRRSKKLGSREVPIPPEILGKIGIATTLGGEDVAQALDINGDGIDELSVTESCGSGGCFGSTWQETGSGYVKILDDLIGIVSENEQNGYRNIFLSKKIYLPQGGFTEGVVRYTWRNGTYERERIIFPPERIKQVANDTNSFFAIESPEGRRGILKGLENVMGTHYTLMAFADMSSGGMIPENMRMDYLREYSRETGKDFLNAYADDPEGFERILFNDGVLNLVVLPPTDPRGYLLVGAKAALKSVARDLKQDPYSKHIERMNRIEQGSGWINAFRSRTGRYPTSHEFVNLYAQGAAGAIREDQLRTHGNPAYVNERRSGSITGETVSREYSPLGMPGDPRAVGARPSPNNGQEMSRQIDQATQQGLERGRQMGNQAEERARQMGNQIQNQLGNIFKKPEKPPQN